jgi:hypothetical protein
VKHKIYEEWANLYKGNKSKEHEMDDMRKAFRLFVKVPRDHCEELGVNGRAILQGFRINKVCSMYCVEVDQTQTS